MPRPNIILFILMPLIACGIFTSCADSSPNFVAHDLTVTPADAVAGEYVLIEFLMDNRGDHGVITDWTLEIDGKEVQTKRISAEERTTSRGYFRITAKETGNHTVTVRSVSSNLSGMFTVTAAPAATD